MATVDSITNPDKMFTDAGIDLIIDRVTGADASKKSVTLAGGREIPYDRLLLAMGGRPAIPPIEGRDLDGVFTLRSAPDAEAIRDYLNEKGAKRLVFIGAGFINLEVATLLSITKPGHYDITVIELLAHPLPLMLDSDMAAPVGEYLAEKGFNLLMGEKVVRISGQDRAVSGVELESGDKITADMVLLSVGATANVELAEGLGLEMGRFGIKVNRFLETSVPGIMAAGDCVDKEHFITKKPVPGQLRGPAVIQGRLAAKRLAGYEIEFPGVLNNSVVKLFDKCIGSVGLTEEEARREGFEPVTATAASRSKHGMIPGMKPWTLKLVFDKKSTRLLGGQIISDAEAPVKEIDAVNALILGEKTAADLTTFMGAGNPDCSSEPSLEPIAICGEQALQKMKG